MAAKKPRVASNVRTRAARIREPLPFNMPKWMWKHFQFLLPRVETRGSFFERIREIFPPTDARYKLIERAYDTAERDFETRPRRDTGEKYFEHLRATALILISYLRVRDADIIAAALLHDIIEDLPHLWTFERLSTEFSERVATIVFWVSKPAKTKRLATNEAIEAKFHRNLREAPREAILVKLSDRLHNFITLWKQNPVRMKRKVQETRDFFIALAEQHIVLIHEIEAVLDLIEERHGF